MLDGICIHLYGPEAGRRHDMLFYAASKVEEILPTQMIVEGKQYTVFRDSGCSWHVYLEVPYGGSNLDDIHFAFNEAMSKVLISVEW